MDQQQKHQYVEQKPRLRPGKDNIGGSALDEAKPNGFDKEEFWNDVRKKDGALPEQERGMK